MNSQKIISQLKTEYPGKNIVINRNEEDEIIEILCEVEPTSDNQDYSMAIAIIDKSIPHYHKELVETYTILKGKLKLHLENKIIELSEGESYEIPINKIHFAEGAETWLKVESKPGWRFDDHIIV